MVARFTQLRRVSVLAAAALGICVALGASAQPPESGDRQNHSLTVLYEKPASNELQRLFETLRESRILETWTG